MVTSHKYEQHSARILALSFLIALICIVKPGRYHTPAVPVQVPAGTVQEQVEPVPPVYPVPELPELQTSFRAAHPLAASDHFHQSDQTRKIHSRSFQGVAAIPIRPSATATPTENPLHFLVSHRRIPSPENDGTAPAVV